MKDWLQQLPQDVRGKVNKTSQPDWTEPMLATLTDRRFSDENWIFERKLDGERCLAFCENGHIRLVSRNQKTLNTHYPELVEALEKQQADQFIIDGEIVAFEDNVTSFSRLQQRMHIESEEEARHSSVAVYYYIFDVLHLEGFDLSEIDLRHRKSILKQVLDFNNRIRFVAHRNKEGEAYFKEACDKGWEGIIAKDAHSAYVHSRSKKWLKFKCVHRQELVIGGYTDPEGERIGFGALLLGYYEDECLRYAGKVGTGFDEETLKWLHEKLEDLKQDDPPYHDTEDLPTGNIHWVEPSLVAQVGFEEWTKSGRLRHPRYLGLRKDKKPKKVTREDC